MEALSKFMEQAADQGNFGLHANFSSLRITHLLFEDDLLVFTDGSRFFLSRIAEVLGQFKSYSGLDMNATKAKIFFRGYSDVEAL